MNERTLRLHADDPEVLALTARALAQSAHLKPSLRIYCSARKSTGRQCRRSLGEIGKTPSGILFTSSWLVPVYSSALFDGERMLQRRVPKFVEHLGGEVRGNLSEEDPQGVVALLNLPPSFPQDYPDLLVRCPSHGDAVLDRHEAVRRLNAAVGDWSVVPEAGVRRGYAHPTADWAALGVPGAQRLEGQAVTWRW